MMKIFHNLRTLVSIGKDHFQKVNCQIERRLFDLISFLIETWWVNRMEQMHKSSSHNINHVWMITLNFIDKTRLSYSIDRSRHFSIESDLRVDFQIDGCNDSTNRRIDISWWSFAEEMKCLSSYALGNLRQILGLDWKHAHYQVKNVLKTICIWLMDAEGNDICLRYSVSRKILTWRKRKHENHSSSPSSDLFFELYIENPVFIFTMI